MKVIHPFLACSSSFNFLQARVRKDLLVSELEAMFVQWFGTRPHGGWDTFFVEQVIIRFLEHMFAPAGEWIAWLRTLMKDYPFHTIGADGTKAMESLRRGAMDVGSTNLEWYTRYVSLARLLEQGIEAIAGFVAPSSLEDNPPVVSATMFYDQGLVTIESGLVNARVPDLGNVVVGILDVPPISGRGSPSHYMHVSLVDLFEWSRRIDDMDICIRCGGGDVFAPIPLTNLTTRRMDRSCFGARRICFALLETILLLEAEGELGPGGGLGFDHPVALPTPREALAKREDAGIALLASSFVGAFVATDDGKSVPGSTGGNTQG